MIPLKATEYRAELDTSMVPSHVCGVLVGVALVAASVFWSQARIAWAAGILVVGALALICLLLNRHARGPGCAATWKDALRGLPADTRIGVCIESDSDAAREAFDSQAPSFAMTTLHLRDRSCDGALQLEGEETPPNWNGEADFGAANMLVQRTGTETALRALFLMSTLLKDGGKIILVDARPLGENGREWAHGTSTLRVENVVVQGPRMWFTGPWKPGYVTVLSKQIRKEEQ